MFRKLNPKAQLSQIYEVSPLLDSEVVHTDNSVSSKHVVYEEVTKGLPEYTEFTLEKQLAAGVALNEVNSIIIGDTNNATIIPDSDVDAFSEHLEENVIIPNE